MIRRWGARGVALYLVALLASLGALVGVQLTGGTSQAALGSFQGIASAEGVHQGTTVPGAPGADTFVDASSPLAQTRVALGESTGLASAPYPGDLVVSGPGLVFGVLAGRGAPVGESPAYPLLAQSSDPTDPEETVDQGVVKLTAKSAEHTSTARAVQGGEAQENGVSRLVATARSEVDPESGVVTAEATSTADLIEVAGLLRIGRLTASAKVVRNADGSLTRSSTLNLSEVTVADQSAVISDKGIVVGGSANPLPDTSPLAAALEQAGITARVVAGQNTADGVISPALEITLEQTVQGRPVLQRYSFGRSVARASALTDPSTVEPPVTEPPVAEPPTTPEGPATPPLDPGTPVVEPPLDGPPVGGQPPVVSQPGTGPVAFGSAAFSEMDTADFYLILVLAGLVAIGGAQLLRVIGVRRTWTS